MAKKNTITLIEEKTIQAGFKTLNLSFDRYMLGLLFFSTYDLQAFNKEGYLTRLVDNFREKDKSCYILFSSFGGVRGASMENIDKVLVLTTSYLALEPIIPEKLSDKMFFSCPNSIYFLILKEGIEYITKIFEYISSIETWCYFIFDQEANKDAFFAKIKDMHTKKMMLEQNIFDLKLEVISLRFAKYSTENILRIFTRRFDREDIRNMLLKSIDPEKFEVKIK